MDLSQLNERGLVLLGCGKMGGALLEGWLDGGLEPRAVHVREPDPSGRLRDLAGQGLHLNADLPDAPAFAVIAIKPQMMGAALEDISALGGGETTILSIAAGTPIATLEKVFAPGTPVIRAMPNTPAAVGRGISALVGNDAVGETQMAAAEELMRAVGRTVRLAHEDQMDAVTGVSGSGPAYVFLLIEAMADAGAAAGLSRDLALELAGATVAGAAHLAEVSDEGPAGLRRNVTSPGGTTEAALGVLMRAGSGLPDLMREAVAAAVARGRALGRPEE